MRASLAQIGPHFSVEIIQPLDDRSPYAKSLTEHGGADHIHHVLFDVADFDDALGRLRELGLESIQHAQFKGASGDGPLLTMTYLATEADLGFTLEIAHAQPGFSMAEPEYVYPSDVRASAPFGGPPLVIQRLAELIGPRPFLDRPLRPGDAWALGACAPGRRRHRGRRLWGVSWRLPGDSCSRSRFAGASLSRHAGVS